MGTLAAHYLQQAGTTVHAALRPALTRHLHTATSCLTISLLGDDKAPIDYLWVATKGPDTASALQALAHRLHSGTTLISLQNGMGTLAQAPLPQGITLLYAVTTNAAWREGNKVHLVAENQTLLGGDLPSAPAWFHPLAAHWPGLAWSERIHFEQWRKLTINAVINPLTAMLGCRNGELLHNPKAQAQMVKLSQECDKLAGHLFPHWPEDTFERSLMVAEATRDNISSMLADVLAQRPTEIDFITGYLVRTAKAHHLHLPTHEALWQQLREIPAPVDTPK